MSRIRGSASAARAAARVCGRSKPKSATRRTAAPFSGFPIPICVPLEPKLPIQSLICQPGDACPITFPPNLPTRRVPRLPSYQKAKTGSAPRSNASRSRPLANSARRAAGASFSGSFSLPSWPSQSGVYSISPATRYRKQRVTRRSWSWKAKFPPTVTPARTT
ncbi:Periplasmic serine proteases (ClpP class) [Caballeronia sordidicola]|uniref:Periplasmic serine proteases (ClpP class) n=1 Tax=Caballeronia sordidicola TaxID=196367 RepID=A0A242MQ38_CABSO|nr:Periplasmic serine proteases (ClpP class) [Caballeronia sordidicola]